MIDPVYYELKIDWNRDFLLSDVIKREIVRLWEDSCFMSSRIETDNHYWGEEIDYFADILLQIHNRKKL